jgi:hypothetical protein
LVERTEEKGLFNLRQVEDLLERTVGHHGHRRLRKPSLSTNRRASRGRGWRSGSWSSALRRDCRSRG